MFENNYQLYDIINMVRVNDELLSKIEDIFNQLCKFFENLNLLQGILNEKIGYYL